MTRTADVVTLTSREVEPLAGEPVAREPVAGEPVPGERVTGEPVAGEPVAGEPVAGEPGLSRRLALAGLPLAALIVLFVLFLASNPLDGFRSAPPQAAGAAERVVFEASPPAIHLIVRNTGNQPLTVSQIIVNDGYWQHSIGDRQLGRFESTNLEILYPWEVGVPVEVGLATSTGDVVRLDLGPASLTPNQDGDTWATYSWVGLFVGLIPVAAGLCVLPLLACARRRLLDFTLAVTVGLLAFLLIDTVLEGWDLATAAREPFQGQEVFVLAAVVTLIVLTTVSGSATSKSMRDAAMPVAVAIGIHNFGEGIAVGAALATGRTDLGLALIVGFAVHNVTEGIAIAATLAREGPPRLPILRLVVLAAVASAPAIPGVWLGGFAFDPTVAAIAFGIATGAILQVLWMIGRPMVRHAGDRVVAAGFGAGLLAMYLTGLLTL
jgi:zinc transporter, ZIP family